MAISRGIAALRARAEQSLSKPELVRTRAQHWQGVVAALDGVLVAAVRTRPAADIRVLVDALHLIAKRLRDRDRTAVLAPICVPESSYLESQVAKLAAAIGQLQPYHAGVPDAATDYHSRL